jgi:O-antigen/teichoic acid export membrane protein
MTWRPPGARDLVRGMFWSQLGHGLPAIAALLLVPRIVHGLGVDRFGVLSIAWLLIGYFTLFDLGVSGALTRMVAERLAASRHQDIPSLIWTSLALTTGMGLLGGTVLMSLAPWIVHGVLRIPPALQIEAFRLTWILAATLPVVTATSALIGVLAAQQRFGALNAVRVPLGVLNYAAPVIVLSFSASLVAIGAALAAMRFAAGLVYLCVCLAVTPGLRARPVIGRQLIRPILNYGSWMTVTAVVGPFMVYLDRFFIGAMLSMAMVAYYTTPYDLVSRLTLLSFPVVSVLFPAIAAGYDTDRARTTRQFDWGMRAVGSLLFPFTLVLAVFAPEALRLWLGPEFAAQGATVLRLLAIGVFLNGLGQVALALVQASGRPDLGARLHLAELPLYLAALWLLIRWRGIEGAALAWLGRVVVDTAILFLLARSRVGGGWAVRRSALASVVAATVIAAGCLIPPVLWRVVFTAGVLTIFALVAWRLVVDPRARALLAPGVVGPAA